MSQGPTTTASLLQQAKNAEARQSELNDNLNTANKAEANVDAAKNKIDEILSLGTSTTPGRRRNKRQDSSNAPTTVSAPKTCSDVLVALQLAQVPENPTIEQINQAVLYQNLIINIDVSAIAPCSEVEKNN